MNKLLLLLWKREWLRFFYELMGNWFGFELNPVDFQVVVNLQIYFEMQGTATSISSIESPKTFKQLIHSITQKPFFYWLR